MVSDRWNCRCMIPWIKCPRHIHIASMIKVKPKQFASEKTRLIAKYGTTKPRPSLKPKVKKKDAKVGGRKTPDGISNRSSSPHNIPFRSMMWARKK